MNWYCDKCKKLHYENELCPRIMQQLKEYPELLIEVTDFATVAGEETLVTTQALDQVAQKMNRVINTNLSYEGTWQYARDVQVFKRLSEEPFSRSEVFMTPENAKAYYENVMKIAENKPRALTSFESKLTGYAQEADWKIKEQGKISSLWRKSSLLEDNAPGVDGVTINRFTGKEISRTTIKASKNTMKSSSTTVKSVKKAIEKGTATEKDIIYGSVGTEKAARAAGLSNPVVEQNTTEQIRCSNQRLEEKILQNQATTAPALQQVGAKMLNGAIVGAAVAVTVSSITSYIRYKNGELTREEAFSDVAEDTTKGALVGSAISAVTIFLPGGAVGFIAGMAIGIYFDKTCSNVLDEIFGKGACGEILNASGYICGMTCSLSDAYDQFKKAENRTKQNINTSKSMQSRIAGNMNLFDKMMEE